MRTPVLDTDFHAMFLKLMVGYPLKGVQTGMPKNKMAKLIFYVMFLS